MADESSGSSSPIEENTSQNEESGGAKPSGGEEASNKPKPAKKVAKTLEDKPGAAASDAPKSDDAGKGRSGSKSGKNVPKTMLEFDVSGLMDEVEKASQLQAEQLAESASEATPEPSSQPKSGSKPAKTMLEHDVSGLMDEIERMSNAEEPESTEPEAPADPSIGNIPEMPPPPPPAHQEKGQDPVARTMLDHAVLWDQVAKAAAAEEVRVIEQIKERANEPVKPFQGIEKFKKSTPCSSVWENPDGKDRFSYCGQCQLQVYDFTGMELPEAEELIFKRENRKNFSLYKRPDGKFLTSDCPVGIKKKRDLVMATVGGIALVACVLGVLLMMPKPAPPPPSQVLDATAGGGGGGGWTSATPKGYTQATTNGSQNNAGSKGAAGPAVNMFNQPDASKNQAGGGADATQPNADGYWEYAPKPEDGAPQPAVTSPTQPVTQPTAAPAQPNASQPAPGNSQPQAGASTAQPQPAPSTAQPQSNGVQYYGR